ncbi:CsiV family protein [Haliea sp. E1-2-M8]|uniref:CsiV family protein n=1 Tax=Haliea sp. E1-2-M8 TaxID=3064706 RepID=UPI002725F907|nr:CsiV family protein [Haliea sp. E1-2-M8]MDO8862408.1 CsiV family protein [Haliea sp. E1-2-M8]
MIRIPARSLLTALLAALPLLPLHAQEEQRWFQVELLVVAHTDPDARGAERWDPLPALAYPERLRFLLDPQRLQANLDRTERAAYSEVDPRGLQRIHLQPQWQPAASPPTTDASTAESAPMPAPAAVDPTQPSAAAEGGAGIEQETATESLAEAPPRLPTPFVQLPASAREFRGKAAYMERNGPYRVLFHEVWWQPVANQRDALPLVLDRSGDSASFPPLQGTITLYLSRFLHLETDLWLNTDGSYLPGSWRMPAPPLGPASLELVAAPLLTPELEEVLDFGAVYDPAWDQAEELAEDTAPAYPWRHAVPLQQQRRMRSNEVHYIDHPLLGLVIKLTPLDAEALQAADYDAAILPLLERPEPPAESPAGF